MQGSRPPPRGCVGGCAAGWTWEETRPAGMRWALDLQAGVGLWHRSPALRPALSLREVSPCGCPAAAPRRARTRKAGLGPQRSSRPLPGPSPHPTHAPCSVRPVLLGPGFEVPAFQSLAPGVLSSGDSHSPFWADRLRQRPGAGPGYGSTPRGLGPGATDGTPVSPSGGADPGTCPAGRTAVG